MRRIARTSLLKRLSGWLLLAVLGHATTAWAQATVEVDGYVLRANAIASLDLTPDVARASGVTRSASRGLLNIAIARRLPDGSEVPVSAAVSADAINDSGQRQVLDLRQVREAGAIYYLGEPRVADGDSFRFEISARPDGTATVLQARFSQTFFAPLRP